MTRKVRGFTANKDHVGSNPTALSISGYKKLGAVVQWLGYGTFDPMVGVRFSSAPPIKEEVRDRLIKGGYMANSVSRESINGSSRRG